MVVMRILLPSVTTFEAEGSMLLGEPDTDSRRTRPEGLAVDDILGYISYDRLVSNC